MNDSVKAVTRTLVVVAAAVLGIAATDRPALAEGGCGPWEPTVCMSGTYWICIGGECDWYTIDTYGKRVGEEQ